MSASSTDLLVEQAVAHTRELRRLSVAKAREWKEREQKADARRSMAHAAEMKTAAEAHGLEVAELSAELSLAAAALQHAERRHAATVGLMATKNGQRRKDTDTRLAKMSAELEAASAAHEEALGLALARAQERTEEVVMAAAEDAVIFQRDAAAVAAQSRGALERTRTVAQTEIESLVRAHRDTLEVAEAAAAQKLVASLAVQANEATQRLEAVCAAQRVEAAAAREEAAANALAALKASGAATARVVEEKEGVWGAEAARAQQAHDAALTTLESEASAARALLVMEHVSASASADTVAARALVACKDQGRRTLAERDAVHEAESALRAAETQAALAAAAERADKRLTNALEAQLTAQQAAEQRRAGEEAAVHAAALCAMREALETDAQCTAAQANRFFARETEKCAEAHAAKLAALRSAQASATEASEARLAAQSAAQSAEHCAALGAAAAAHAKAIDARDARDDERDALVATLSDANASAEVRCSELESSVGRNRALHAQKLVFMQHDKANEVAAAQREHATLVARVARLLRRANQWEDTARVHAAALGEIERIVGTASCEFALVPTYAPRLSSTNALQRRALAEEMHARGLINTTEFEHAATQVIFFLYGLYRHTSCESCSQFDSLPSRNTVDLCRDAARRAHAAQRELRWCPSAAH